MKLLGSTKNKITNNKNGENASHLEITEITQQVLYTILPNKSFDILLIIRYFTQTFYIFKIF